MHGFEFEVLPLGLFVKILLLPFLIGSAERSCVSPRPGPWSLWGPAAALRTAAVRRSGAPGAARWGHPFGSLCGPGCVGLRQLL